MPFLAPSARAHRRFKFAWLVYGLPLVLLGGAFICQLDMARPSPWIYPLGGLLFITAGVLAWFEERSFKILALILWGLVFVRVFPVGSIYAVFAVAFLLSSFRPKWQPSPSEVAAMPAIEIRGLVERAAGDSLGIGGPQIERSMDDLKIPLGEFQRFLEDLQIDYGLEVPKHAWKGSTSIAGVVAALEEKTLKSASERLY